ARRPLAELIEKTPHFQTEGFPRPARGAFRFLGRQKRGQIPGVRRNRRPRRAFPCQAYFPKEDFMKRMLAFAATLSFLVPLASADAATVVKEKHNGRVVVRHVHGHPGAVLVRPMERRPHHFWHRGAWTVRLHGPAFRYPHGWHMRHWAVGAVLPALFLSSEYY